jgi:hypothetical protein
MSLISEFSLFKKSQEIHKNSYQLISEKFKNFTATDSSYNELSNLNSAQTPFTSISTPLTVISYSLTSTTLQLH